MSVHLSLRKVTCGPQEVGERLTQVLIMGGCYRGSMDGMTPHGDTFRLLPPLQNRAPFLFGLLVHLVPESPNEVLAPRWREKHLLALRGALELDYQQGVL